MTKHLVRLVWSRRRASALLVAEVFFSFVVLFAVTAATAWAIDGLRRPLGFDVARVLSAEIRANSSEDAKPDSEFRARLEDALRRARALPEVEGVAAVMSSPYSTSTWESNSGRKGRTFTYQENFASDELADVLGLKLTAGRWFSREDDAATGWKPVVINERLRREMFGAADPLGEAIADPPRERADGDDSAPRRVVGVVTDFRKDGEIAPFSNYVFNRVVPSRASGPLPRNLVVKVRPGTPPSFEETLARALRDVDPRWSVVVKPVSELRAASLKLRLAPFVFLVLVGLFLLLMVVLGLTGVVWQNVTKRTRELGLRRAKGSTRGQVFLLVAGEIVVVTSFGVIPALAVLLQIPLLGALPAIGTGVYLSSLAVSVAGMFLLTFLCALAPARMATRLSPAEALHYE
jgi:putative ABC transport system permease protein